MATGSAGRTPPRIGFGFDAHRLVEGTPLVVGGVRIPYPKGLEGHSDGDVLSHAIIDALLGAAALGDIGEHFPDTDPQYRGISSLALLKRVRRLLKENGWHVGHVDVTILAQEPRFGTHKDQMKKAVAETLGVEECQVSVKATTAEGLGFTGRGEGIAAMAVASLTG